MAFWNVSLWGQSPSIVINENFKNTSLKEVFSTLEKKYDLHFSYDNEIIKDLQITASFEEQSLSEVLRSIAYVTRLEYQIVNNTQVLIREKIEKEQPVNPIEKIRIKGRITDAENNIPLSFATVYQSYTLGTEANEEGFFDLEVPFENGEATVYVQYVGYETQKLELDKKNIDQPLKIHLSPQIQEIASITVVEQVPLLSQSKLDGSLSFKANKLGTLPAFVGGKDVFRTLQLLPGISAHDDLSAELSIRGSNGDESMIVFDGITLYNVTHYFGIFSAINPNITDEVTIYKNAFPVEYGGRTSGVVDITSTDILKTKPHFGAEFNLLTTNVWAELPMNENMGLLVGGRFTNKNIANNSLFASLNQEVKPSGFLPNSNLQEKRENFLTQIEPNFQFYDFNLKWDWRISPKTNVTLSYFQGDDRFEYTAVQNIDLRRKDNKVIITDTESSNWKNQGSSLQLKHEWSEALDTKMIFSRSGYSTNTSAGTKVERLRNEQQTTHLNFDGRHSNAIDAWEVNIKNNWQMHSNHRLSFGYHFVNSQIGIGIQNRNRNALNRTNATDQHALLLEYQGNWKDKLFFNAGLRPTWYTGTQSMYFSPRLSLSYAADERFHLKASASRYHQFIRELSYENPFGRTYEYWVLADNTLQKSFPVASSVNWMVGFNFQHDWFDLDVEFYQKNTNGVVEQATDLNYLPTVRDTFNFQFFKGRGRTRGMDILLKKTSGQHTGWIAYTLSKSTNRFPKINNGKAFPSKNDRRHQLKFIYQYQWRKWDFATTYVFSSGRPYTNLSILDELPMDRGNIPPERRLGYLDDYHRVDVGIHYNFTIRNTKAQVGLSIFNLFNRTNVKYRQYILSIQQEPDNGAIPPNVVLGTELDMLGITPNVSFGIKF